MVDTIKDLWASLMAYVQERTTNPLTSAFAVSWCGWNYKFFVVLFSDETPAEKFAAIADLYPAIDPWYCRLAEGAFLYPLLVALVYVFAYPFLSHLILPFYRQRQINLANALKLKEGTRIRDPKDVARMVRQHEKELQAITEEANVLRTQIETLRDALAQAETEVKPAVPDATDPQQHYERDKETGAFTTPRPTEKSLRIEENPDRDAEPSDDILRGSAINEKNGEILFVENPNPLIPQRAARSGYTTQEIEILGQLRNGDNVSIDDLSTYLKVEAFEVLTSVAKLKNLDLAYDTRQGTVRISENGQFLLKNLIQEGKYSRT